MKNKLLLILVLSLSLILSETADASSIRKNKAVTPYGDFCERFNHYGMHKHALTNKDVEESLQHYYGNKGLGFRLIKSEGRFLKAVIKNKDNIVDTIIFDRQTGRIRSIY